LPITFAGESWTPVPLSVYEIIIETGSFYVGWTETDQTPEIGVDSDSPSDNSYIDVGIGLGFQPFGDYWDGAIMIRAEVDSLSSTSSIDLNTNIPGSFELRQNYPNPFNPITTIEFSLVSEGLVNISLYDIAGRKVKDIHSQTMGSGYHSIKLDASGITSGMYLYSLNMIGKNNDLLFSSTRKLVLLK